MYCWNRMKPRSIRVIEHHGICRMWLKILQFHKFRGRLIFLLEVFWTVRILFLDKNLFLILKFLMILAGVFLFLVVFDLLFPDKNVSCFSVLPYDIFCSCVVDACHSWSFVYTHIFLCHQLNQPQSFLHTKRDTSRLITLYLCCLITLFGLAWFYCIGLP